MACKRDSISKYKLVEVKTAVNLVPAVSFCPVANRAVSN